MFLANGIGIFWGHEEGDQSYSLLAAGVGGALRKHFSMPSSYVTIDPDLILKIIAQSPRE